MLSYVSFYEFRWSECHLNLSHYTFLSSTFENSQNVLAKCEEHSTSAMLSRKPRRPQKRFECVLTYFSTRARFPLFRKTKYITFSLVLFLQFCWLYRFLYFSFRENERATISLIQRIKHSLLQIKGKLGKHKAAEFCWLIISLQKKWNKIEHGVKMRLTKSDSQNPPEWGIKYIYLMNNLFRTNYPPLPFSARCVCIFLNSTSTIVWLLRFQFPHGTTCGKLSIKTLL